MMGVHMTNSLTQFPPVVLRDMADQVRLYAERLDHAAFTGEYRIKEGSFNRQYRKRAGEATTAFRALVDDGVDPDQAAQQAADQHTVDPASIRALAPSFKRRMNRMQDIELDRQIMKLHRSGLSDPEIAAEVGKHRNTVATRRRRLMED